MSDTPHPSDLDLRAIATRLLGIMKTAKLNATQFAAEVGTPYSTLRAYTSGARAPSAEMLAAIFTLFGALPSWVLTGKGPQTISQAGPQALEQDFVMIDRHDTVASAGLGPVDADYIGVGSVCFRKSWVTERGLRAQDLLAVDVCGGSMEGLLSDGDMVLVDKSQTTPRSGFAYVLQQGSELLVKYCQLLPDGVLKVSSENKAFEPYDIDLKKATDVSIIGRVVASTHEW